MPRPSTEVNGSGISASPSVKSLSSERFAGRWRNFEADVRGLSEFSQHIGALEDSLDKGNRLESELRAKNVEISSYKAGRQQMLEGFAESDRTWKEKESKLAADLRTASNKVKSLEGELADLKGASVSNELFERRIREMGAETSRKVTEAMKEKAGEVQGLQKTKNGAEKKLKTLEGELSTKSKLLIGSEAQLEICRKELEERNKEIGLEELNADFSSNLMNLSMRFHELAKECFFTTLPKEINADVLFIELQRSGFINAISRPIPISNTQASKYLRMAAAEAIIAKKLCKEMFQPLYVLEFPARDELDNILNRLFKKNYRQGSILRSLLLNAHEDEQIRETRIVVTIADDASSLLAPLLFDQAHSEAFKNGLEVLLRDAVELWSHAQRSPGRILASTEDRGWNWGFHKEHDDAVSLTAAQTTLIPSSLEPLMTLFPRVYSHEISAPFHAGFSLWSDQSVVVAGDLESKEQIDRVNSRNGKMTSVGGKRRISVSNTTGPSLSHQRTKGLSSSTRSAKIESGSFSGRVNESQLERSLVGQSGSG